MTGPKRSDGRIPLDVGWIEGEESEEASQAWVQEFMTYCEKMQAEANPRSIAETATQVQYIGGVPYVHLGLRVINGESHIFTVQLSVFCDMAYGATTMLLHAMEAAPPVEGLDDLTNIDTEPF